MVVTNRILQRMRRAFQAEVKLWSMGVKGDESGDKTFVVRKDGKPKWSDRESCEAFVISAGLEKALEILK